MEITLQDLLNLLEDVTSEDSCRFDVNGHCQEHLWFDDDQVCPHKRSQELLKSWHTSGITVTTHLDD